MRYSAKKHNDVVTMTKAKSVAQTKSKLWAKGNSLNSAIEKFTVGKDPELDLKLIQHDCTASKAHAQMLKKMGMLTKGELDILIAGLKEISELAEEGKFNISVQEEDCHTAIENYLTEHYGDVGKKIHVARSRNDQVLAALRLYEKEEISKVAILLSDFIATLESKIDKHGKLAMPGYTHMQPAMPTSVSTWLGSFVDSAKDDLFMIDAVMELIDQNPLGSAAGFGVPVLDIDNAHTTQALGFSKSMNPMYAQLSRGKFEAAILAVCSQLMLSLNKLATDLLLFSTNEFSMVSIPSDLCTGSSIMPQKKNADVLELVRASYGSVLADEFKIKNIAGNLISGYNRDMQLTKEPLMDALDNCQLCVSAMTLVVSGVMFNKKSLKAAMVPELYATEKAYTLVKKGMPFRDAYKKVGKKFS